MAVDEFDWLYFFRLSKEDRAKSVMKKRYIWHFCQNTTVTLTVIIGYGILGSAFIKVPQEYQWILALIAPFVRDATSRTITFFVSKAAGTESEKSTILVKHYVSTKHTIFLAVIVGGVATPATTYTILATDLVMAIYPGLKILRKHRKGINIKGDIYLHFTVHISSTFVCVIESFLFISFVS